MIRRAEPGDPRLARAPGDPLLSAAIQGEAMGRPGSMEVRVALENGQPGEIQIVGNAVVAFRTTLELDGDFRLISYNGEYEINGSTPVFPHTILTVNGTFAVQSGGNVQMGQDAEIIVNGEQTLISINTGLNQQLTGEENINVKGALMGFSKKRIQEIKESVINFAELGDFLYQPVKKYSSGMKSRLGFSISLALNPDIIIVDEALSVGDKGFAQKCMKHMKKLRDEDRKP